MVAVRRDSLARQVQPGNFLLSIDVRLMTYQVSLKAGGLLIQQHRTGLQNLPTRVRLGYIILAVTWLATQLSLLCSCRPFHAFWQINPDPGSQYPRPSISYSIAI